MFIIRTRKIAFYGCAETLRRVLYDMGFTFGVRNGVRYLIEKPDVVHKRLVFLKKFVEDFKGMYVVWLDETWIFQKGSHKTREWQDEDVRSCSVRTNATGYRYIICHAGGKDGFVDGASLIHCSSKRIPDIDEDYHGDMNSEIFQKWLQKQLLPNLDKPSIIVMDNAPYHSVEVYTSKIYTH